MQVHLLVGPISVSPPSAAVLLSLHDSKFFLSNAPPFSAHRRRRFSRWSPLVVASAAAINGGQNHYAVLGIAQTATSAEIKKAYRLLARKYHPDVSKDSQAPELFKSIRHAYEVLSNEAMRTQYDKELQFGRRPYRKKWSYSTEFEDQVRMYRWANLRKKVQSERYWEHYYDDNAGYDGDEANEAEEGEGNLDEERGSFIEVLRSAFMSLFLFKTLGSRLSLTYSSVMALVDEKLDIGYKIGYVIALILGGRGGILLTLCLSFASWVCGKTSSSVVVLVMVAMWIGSHLARYVPLPQGALLTLIYMSIKLQSDQL
ncbi:hypothetical protein TanjilG_19910 [Lupinus angustifolius]|uniref:J domain-containing protein n=1 Tax=Lupinus angustifolius TaxID=3871 RepID=A0A1J7FNQ0_LUPAN|nr:PREDICTED: dnaJ homolog subfamily B member 14 [Lupinus angustifolius]OIV89543.1 hypothetical protein TanjilG_19910 [Lupinus angustifolius]